MTPVSVTAKTTVLMVDDEPQILRTLRINLSARGYQVFTAATGAAALRAAAEARPDVVVLDLGLPDMSGIDVLAGLRGWTSTPVIVLSARTDASDKIEALDAGADDYVTKPFGMDEFLARLRAAVRRGTASTAEPAALSNRPSTVAQMRRQVGVGRRGLARVLRIRAAHVLVRASRVDSWDNPAARDTPTA